MAIVLFLMFILIPILEISVIIQVGSVLGVFPTVALMILSAMIGASLVRSQGIATLFAVRQKLAQGLMPSTEIIEGLLLLVAGVLLVTPGFVTDGIGILILTAPFRRAIAALLVQRFRFNLVSAASASGGDPFAHHGTYGGAGERVEPFKSDPLTGKSTGQTSRHGHVIDGEFERKD